MYQNIISFFLVMILLSACAGIRDPALLKYEACAAEVNQRTARGEITQMEADNLKMQAYLDYQEVRRREEKEFRRDSFSQQVNSQNQEMNAIAKQSF